MCLDLLVWLPPLITERRRRCGSTCHSQHCPWCSIGWDPLQGVVLRESAPPYHQHGGSNRGWRRHWRDSVSVYVVLYSAIVTPHSWSLLCTQVQLVCVCTYTLCIIIIVLWCVPNVCTSVVPLKADNVSNVEMPTDSTMCMCQPFSTYVMHEACMGSLR